MNDFFKTLCPNTLAFALVLVAALQGGAVFYSLSTAELADTSVFAGASLAPYVAH